MQKAVSGVEVPRKAALKRSAKLSGSRPSGVRLFSDISNRGQPPDTGPVSEGNNGVSKSEPPLGTMTESNASDQVMVPDIGTDGQTTIRTGIQNLFVFSSVAVPDPNPDPDPHVFGAPGSGSTSQSYESGSGSCSGSGSFYHHAKILRKTLIPTIL
jgi:hypothetical protein